MFFMLSSSFGGIADPATLLAFVILCGGVTALARCWRLAALFQGIGVAIVLLFGILPGANWLALPLESRFPASPDLPSDVAGIIALGGTERVEQSAVWGQPTLNDPGPIAALMNLGHRYPQAKLVFTGGIRAANDSGLTEASVVRDFVNELGANAASILFEDRARNTRENAVITYELLHPKPGEHWILVCQAIGMPRAVGAFRRAGWDVIPFPAGYLTGSKHSAALSFDLLGGLNLAYLAVHEWIGLIVYRLIGYTDEMFPR